MLLFKLFLIIIIDNINRCTTDNYPKATLKQAAYTIFFRTLQGIQKVFFAVNFQQQFFTLCKRFFLSFFSGFCFSPAACFIRSMSENKMLVIKFDVNWNAHWKHISFMALFYLPTPRGRRLQLQLQLQLPGYYKPGWAAFPHCAARTLFIVPGPWAWGALESAGADNNSYMWHDEFLATRSTPLC